MLLQLQHRGFPAASNSRALLYRSVLCTARPYRSTDPIPSVTYISRSVREDEHVEAPGNVVVHGDVSANASIEAGGDVMVWGRLSGHVHAGSTGDRSAVISALELRGAQLVIAHATSMGAARITVPGPHTASVLLVGRNLTMNLTPLGPSHPPLNPIGLTSSVRRWLAWYPAAAAALFTGCYALLAGLALLLAPKTVLGLLFNASTVPSIWIRVGGVLFATFGAQYLGTAIADYRQVLAASTSSSGCPDMPFRPASPHPADRQLTAQQQRQAAPAAVAAAFQSHPPTTPQPPPVPAAAAAAAAPPVPVAASASGAFSSTAAAAMLHDSSSAYSTQLSSNGGGSIAAAAASTAADDVQEDPGSSSSSSVRAVGRSVPANQLTSDQVERLRQTHKRRSRAEAAAAAAAASAAEVGSNTGSGSGGLHAAANIQPLTERQQQQQDYYSLLQQQQQQQPLQQQSPPTWAYCSSGFYEASVWARLGLAVTFTALVGLCGGPPGLLVLALVNLFGALSMWGALRRQWLMHVMGDMPEAADAYVAAS